MKVELTNWDKAEGATEYKVWWQSGSQAEYFQSFDEAMNFFNSLTDTDKQIEAIWLIVNVEVKDNEV